MHITSTILRAFAEIVQGLPEAGQFQLVPTFPYGQDEDDLETQVRMGTLRLGNQASQPETSGRPKSVVLDRAIEVVLTVMYPVQSMAAVFDFEDDVVSALETAVAESDLLARISRDWFLAKQRSLSMQGQVGVQIREMTWMVNVKTIANKPGLPVG